MHEITIKAEEIFRIGSWPVTNSVLLSLVSLTALLGLAFALYKRIAPVPGKLQGFFEMFLEEVLKLMDNILGSRRLSEKYLPLVTTIFLFIITSNWLGLAPFIGPLGIRNVNAPLGHGGEEALIPLFRSPASDLNFTMALAIIAVLGVNFIGMTAVGARRHLAKFFTVRNPILSFTGLLEFISEFVKIVSFSFRLFGNVFAGEVLLVIVGFLAPYFLPLPFMFLEVFVGFIQAFIFSMLTLVFIAMAVNEEPAH